MPQSRNMLKGLRPRAVGGGKMILVTGSSGLVGRHVCTALERAHHTVRQFDIERSPDEDVCNADAVAGALSGVSGVVHLAAVARVIDGERVPDRCRRVNVDGLKTVLDAVLHAPGRKPWVVFVSSREVYGNAAQSPTREDTALCALNTYAQTKIAGETLVEALRKAGVVANICRLSTVYGATHDYPDRVLPAFCRAAAFGGEIHVDGHNVVVDPTHIGDVARGLALLAGKTADGHLLPPVHFVSGRGYTLLRLAELAIAAGEASTRVTMRRPRDFDVSRFVGDPGRAEALLGWRAQTRVEDGIRNFVRDFRILHGSENYRAGAVRVA